MCVEVDLCLRCSFFRPSNRPREPRWTRRDRARRSSSACRSNPNRGVWASREGRCPCLPSIRQTSILRRWLGRVVPWARTHGWGRLGGTDRVCSLSAAPAGFTLAILRRVASGPPRGRIRLTLSSLSLAGRRWAWCSGRLSRRWFAVRRCARGRAPVPGGDVRAVVGGGRAGGVRQQDCLPGPCNSPSGETAPAAVRAATHTNPRRRAAGSPDPGPDVSSRKLAVVKQARGRACSAPAGSRGRGFRFRSP